MGDQRQKYTDQQLYGADNQPQLTDIRQDLFNNCYLVSSMGALAAQQPDRILEAIRYQPDPNRPDAGAFLVTLHHPTHGKVNIPVTQADVEYNIQRGGGGIADNKRGSPVWPSVMEAAFAKLYDPDPQNDNRKEGYDIIADETRGGSLHEAMFALTGEIGHNLRYSNAPKGPSAPPGNTGEKPPFDVPLTGRDVTRFDDADGAYALLREALDANKAVTMSTRNADVNDGLMPHHAYVVTGIEQCEKKDGSHDTWITLRNPYAHNNVAGENRTTSKPETTVSLDKMLQNGVLGEFNLSPAPRVQTQQQSVPAAAPEQAAPVSSAPNPSTSPLLNTHDITHPTHLGHLRYQQALHAIEHSPNIPPGTFTGERLQQAAANVAYASLAGEERTGLDSRNEVLSRIDFVVFNKDRTPVDRGPGRAGKPGSKAGLVAGHAGQRQRTGRHIGAYACSVARRAEAGVSESHCRAATGARQSRARTHRPAALILMVLPCMSAARSAMKETIPA
jgi:hypothetical protein